MPDYFWWRDDELERLRLWMFEVVTMRRSKQAFEKVLKDCERAVRKLSQIQIRARLL